MYLPTVGIVQVHAKVFEVFLEGDSVQVAAREFVADDQRDLLHRHVPNRHQVINIEIFMVRDICVTLGLIFIQSITFLVSR
jgi:hypothetical protein